MFLIQSGQHFVIITKTALATETWLTPENCVQTSCVWYNVAGLWWYRCAFVAVTQTPGQKAKTGLRWLSVVGSCLCVHNWDKLNTSETRKIWHRLKTICLYIQMHFNPMNSWGPDVSYLITRQQIWMLWVLVDTSRLNTQSRTAAHHKCRAMSRLYALQSVMWKYIAEVQTLPQLWHLAENTARSG
jgi:hypothetical protein